MNPVTKTFQYGGQTVTLETGRIARQASGAVLVTVENASVLCTVVAEKSMRPGREFFPLAVHYTEKTYAVGKIPGGFFKREARPSEKETLTSRLIDRPIRPLFPAGFMNEVQVICMVVSADKHIDPDIAAMIGTSTASAAADTRSDVGTEPVCPPPSAPCTMMRSAPSCSAFAACLTAPQVGTQTTPLFLSEEIRLALGARL